MVRIVMRIPELIPAATRTRNRIGLETDRSSTTKIRTNVYNHQIKKKNAWRVTGIQFLVVI
jgi:hypothetical protein